MAVYDLFVSYSSKDRPWAKKVHDDLLASFPQLQIFFDRTSIMAGVSWREDLKNAIRNSKHLLLFWSENAARPNNTGAREVDWEIEGFLAHRDLTPKLEGSERSVFYVPLEGDRGGGIAGVQGFPDFKTLYKPQAEDLGISSLEFDPGKANLARMIRMVGDAISHTDGTDPVFAGIIATNAGELALLDVIHARRKKPDGPTLDQFLAGFGLTWEKVRSRYGLDALDWRPQGTDTIVTMLEEVRVRVNAKLSNAAYRFHWQFVDLTSEQDYARNIKNICENPSVVLFDPISLYDSNCAGVLLDLREYVRQDKSVVISLSPTVRSVEDLPALYLRSVSNLLDDWLHPFIPPDAVFYARCALDLERTSQIDPLVRNRIRYPHLEEKRKADREKAKEIAGLR